MSVGIINYHHRKNLGVIINHFSSSATLYSCKTIKDVNHRFIGAVDIT
jgi:hypothetical protein